MWFGINQTFNILRIKRYYCNNLRMFEVLLKKVLVVSLWTTTWFLNTIQSIVLVWHNDDNKKCRSYIPCNSWINFVCRYHVHPKLVNFMAPKETCNWTDEARYEVLSNAMIGYHVLFPCGWWFMYIVCPLSHCLRVEAKVLWFTIWDFGLPVNLVIYMVMCQNFFLSPPLPPPLSCAWKGGRWTNIFVLTGMICSSPCLVREVWRLQCLQTKTQWDDDFINTTPVKQNL